jgi:hypothetical protein
MEHSETSEPLEGAIGEGDGVPDAPRAELTLEARVALIESEWRAMQVEWLSMYDQFRSLYGRISRRQQREDQQETRQERPINPVALSLLNGGSR